MPVPCADRPAQPIKEIAMAHQQHEACIEACNECAVACNHCASACLQESDVKSMVRCIALDLECADICRLAVASMARGGEFAAAFCAVCADVCDACGEECAKHPMDHCHECAKLCRRCADACRQMTGQAAGERAGSGKSAHAH